MFVLLKISTNMSVYAEIAKILFDIMIPFQG